MNSEKRYMVIHESLGWLIALRGKAGPKAVSEILPAGLACKTVNLLNDTYDPEWDTAALALAEQLNPDWVCPCWLPDFARRTYGARDRRPPQERRRPK